MSRKVPKSPPVALDLSTDESEACAVAAALTEYLMVPMTVANLVVDSGPTVWWHVYCPNAHVARANTWIAGYKAHSARR